MCLVNNVSVGWQWYLSSSGPAFSSCSSSYVLPLTRLTDLLRREVCSNKSSSASNLRICILMRYFFAGKVWCWENFFVFRVTFVEMHCFLKKKTQVNARNKILLFISLAFKRDPQESLRKMIYRDLSSLNCLDDY